MKTITLIMLLLSVSLMAVTPAELEKTDALHDASEYETELVQLETMSSSA